MSYLCRLQNQNKLVQQIKRQRVPYLDFDTKITKNPLFFPNYRCLLFDYLYLKS